MEALAWGLLCRDLAYAGWDYEGAVAYWDVEGRPARMDADENGIPCETVYRAGDVTAFWGDPLPTGLAPGPGSGWHTTDRTAPATEGCCGMNDNAPVSPALPPESGPFPEDGAYSVSVTRQQGETDSLALEIRRWLPCSERPDQCAPDVLAGDVYPDPANGVLRIVRLDDSLTVVVKPIGHFVDAFWTDLPSIEGNGAAFASLLRRVDAAVAMRAANPDLPIRGATDPTDPFGPSADGEDWGYRGPEGTYLTAYVLDPNAPPGMYEWWCTLEIVDGAPVLYVWAGQIAG